MLPDEWGPPVDAGAPVAEGDGAIRFVLADLAPDASFGIAVSAYGADGSESALSNEIQIGPGGGPPACGDACEPRSGCPLVTSRFALKRKGDGWRLVLRGAFPAAMAESAALAVSVSGDAASLLAETVPDSEVRARRRSSAFRYRPGRRGGGQGGIRRLVLRSRGDATDVALTATLPATEGGAAPDTVSWSLQVGDGCARTDDLACTARRRAVVVCD